MRLQCEAEVDQGQIKPSPGRGQPQRTARDAELRQKPNPCLRPAPRAHSQAPPPQILASPVPRLRQPPRAMQTSLGRQIRRWRGCRGSLRVPTPWPRQLLSQTCRNHHLPELHRYHGREKSQCWRCPMRDGPNPKSSGRAAAKMLCRAKLRCQCHFAYMWECPGRQETP